MIIGTAGHIDHGKTALVRALTGVDTDRLPEEKTRGISIDLGFAYLPTPDGRVLGFVDVPGHERFIRNMLAGATGIDFVLLVVAADDGIMPQTREHLAIVDLLGVTSGIVALTKADLVDAVRLDQLAGDVAAALADTGLAGCPIVPVSSLNGEGIAALRTRLMAAADIRRAGGGRFRLAVDRAFTLTGVGTIVTGTVQSGSVAVGAQLMVSPSGLAARVRSVHAQNRPAVAAHAGDRCALNLSGDRIGKDAIARGDVVLDPELHAPTQRIDATLRVLASEPAAMAQWMPVRLHHGAAEVGARVVLLEETAISPGTVARVQLVLERPIAAACGDRFVLRDTSGRRTIGGGRLLDLRAPARRRRTAKRHRQLDALTKPQPADALAALAALAPFYVDLAAFARDHALAATEVDDIGARLRLVRLAGTTVALAEDGWQRLKGSLAETLRQFHAANPDQPGLGLERLRREIDPRLPAPAFAAALQTLARMKEVAIDGAWVRLPTHARQLKPEDERLWQRIRPLLSGAARFRPPRVNEIAGHLATPEANVRRLLKLLGRVAEVDEIAPDHFFLRATVIEMVEIAADIAAGTPSRQLTAAQFRDRLDNGRKVAIQILEFLDRHGVTLRNGDLRRMNPQRINLLRRPGGGGEAAGKRIVPGGASGLQIREGP